MEVEKQTEEKLCREECDIKHCEFEPSHCPYGIQRQAERADFILDQCKEAGVKEKDEIIDNPFGNEVVGYK